MSYPILRTSRAKEIGEEINHALDTNPESFEVLDPKFRGFQSAVEYRQGGEFDQTRFETQVRNFEKNLREDRLNNGHSRVRLEEDFAQHIVEQLGLISDAALQDPDFWRYLSLFQYRRYIFQLEGDLSIRRYGGLGNRDMVRWTLIRGLLWGLRTFQPDIIGDGQFDLARAYRQARLENGLTEGWVPEFYISQIVRRYWNYSNETYLAFIETVIESPALLDLSNEVRPTQKLGASVSRLSANIFLPSLSREEISNVIRDEKLKILAHE